MRRARWRGVAAMVPAMILALMVIGCGAVDAGGPATGGFSDTIVANKIAVNADPRGTLRWERPEYEGKAGDVTFVVGNPSTVSHNFVLEGNGIKVASRTIGAKKTQNLTLTGLAPGEYQIVCTLPGHREAGMVARLVLK